MKREPAHWPRAVVFDLDGTLIDSAGDLKDALNYALGLRGLPQFSMAEVKGMVGGGIAKLVGRALEAQGVPGEYLAPLAADFLKYYGKNLTVRTARYEGAVELLERFKSEGRLLGLCTNKKHEFTVTIAKELGIAKYFGAIVGEREGQPRKPDAAPLLNVLETLGVAPADAVMVGDSGADVECAKAAGVVAVIVRYGYAHSDPDGLGAAAAIDRLSDLPGCLERLAAGRE
jgi:phosphoglycolate phosphatase